MARWNGRATYLTQRDLLDDLALGGAGAGVGLVGVDVHGGGKVAPDADDHVVKDQLAAFLAAGHFHDLLVGHAQLLSVFGGDVDVTLGHDDAFLQLHLAAGANQLAAGGTGGVAGLTHGSGNADGTGVGGGQLHLIRAAAGSEDGHVGQLTLGAHHGDALVGGVLAGLAQGLLDGQLIARAEQGLQGLLADMHMTGRGLNQKFHCDISSLYPAPRRRLEGAVFPFAVSILAHGVKSSRQNTAFCDIISANVQGRCIFLQTARI